MEATDADMAFLEEIKECAADLSRPFPASPAEVLVNHMADFAHPRMRPPPVLRASWRGRPTAAMAVAVAVTVAMATSVSVAVVEAVVE